MRVPAEAAAQRPRLMRRYQMVILLSIIALIVLVFIVQALANAYTNYLWYRSFHLTMVWRSMAETKLGLGATFSCAFFLVCWASLALVDRASVQSAHLVPDYELVRRYEGSGRRFRLALRTIVSLVFALIVGAGTSGQWQHWQLFLNGGTFGIKDPEFHRDVGYFVFKLPFLSFLANWGLLALFVLFILTTVAYFFTGGIRVAGPSPRIDPAAIGHLSLILAFMALVRAAGYFFIDRYAIDLANDSVVRGAGYTDVHVRLPALSILAAVCMIGFVLLTYNVYQRTLVLPAVAFGLWVFLAIVLGAIFPAIVQWLEVNPSQSKVELPYIERNIRMTRDAYDLNSVKAQAFGAHTDLNASVIDANKKTLDALALWSPQVAEATYDNLQALHGYYALSALSLDRYELRDGSTEKVTPVVIGTRDVVPSDLPRKTWVSEHLEYTHGYGVVMSPANTSTSSGQPTFSVSGAPVSSVKGAPRVKEPDIYYGDSQSTYVVVDTHQAELDYVNTSGAPVENHYSGSGGVQLSGFWQRLAYAIHFHDINLLVSNLITSKSRIIYQQDVEEMVQKAAPFLKVDSHPYPVVANGSIYWVVDCYTTTSYFPYSEDASTRTLAASSGLQGQYNYVRNSVIAVVNAYSGKLSFFASTPSDPILIAWEHAYPGMFKPLKDMAQLSPKLLDHLKYPQDLLMVLSEMYGRYRFHATPSQASQFYSLQNSWVVAEQSSNVAFDPTYELLRLPGQSELSFVAVEPMVPQSSSGRSQLLTSFLVANCDYGGYGSITAYELPRVTSSALGPALVAAKIQNNPTIAKQVTLLGQEHSRVLLGPTLLVPIDDSLIYVQALYVTSTDRPFPALEYVLTDFGAQSVGFAPTLVASLRQIFGSGVTAVGPSSSETVSQQVEQDLSLAYDEYEKSVTDGKEFKLGALQRDLEMMGQYLQQAHDLEQQESSPHASSGSKSPSASKGHTSSAQARAPSATRASAKNRAARKNASDTA